MVGTDSSRPRPPSTNNGGMDNGSIHANITMGNEDAMMVFNDIIRRRRW